jgi:hypothetical protein
MQPSVISEPWAGELAPLLGELVMGMLFDGNDRYSLHITYDRFEEIVN